jgi:poly-gamma-glutamate capsule biosynthesis protein CapA/YwtB (metallophosphatase superfamily)
MSRVVLHAVGDILPALNMVELMATHGYEYPFCQVAPVLRSADLVFGNLECSLSRRGQPFDSQQPGGKYFCGPPEAIQGLHSAGFNVLNLANNHILDFGPEALADTVALLQESGIHIVGVGADRDEARRPLCLTTGGVRVAFLAYSSRYPAGRDSPGNTPFDFRVMRADVRRVRSRADVVVVSCHFGIEFFSYPLPQHRQTLHRLVGEGADLILGHHPHVLQGIERFGRGIIAYSLGNFVFDNAYEAEEALTRPRASVLLGREVEGANLDMLSRSVIFRCELTQEGVGDYELIPIRLNEEGQPAIANGGEAEAILSEVERLSANLDGAAEFDLQELQDAKLRAVLSTRLRRNPLAMLHRLHRLRRDHLRFLIRSLCPGSRRGVG